MSTSAVVLIDSLIVLGFGLQHSVLATLRVKSYTSRVFGIDPVSWRSVESICNILYILCVIPIWQTSDVTVWETSGTTAVMLSTLLLASWLWYWQLHIFEYDCGLAFGSTTLISAISKQPVPRPALWKVGLRRWIRFPVHTAFFGMFLSFPVMTLDLLVLGLVLNIYNVIGTVLYDRRLESLIGKDYREYQSVTGLIWPPLYRSPHGAANLDLPSPRHWTTPLKYWPAPLGGVILGVLYTQIIVNPIVGSWQTSISVIFSALLGSTILAPFLLFTFKPNRDNWNDAQTEMSTTVALSAAIGVIVWIIYHRLHTGLFPNIGYYLVLWFTVQYFGHVAFALLQPKQEMASVLRTNKSA